jgi:abequosyltransferase
MTSLMLLSICIPTLNRGTFIGETLESLTAQLSDGVEIVIVDGGSTDGTEQIVQGFVSRFPRIRYVRSKLSNTVPSNQGFDRDCDLAVELAQGTYCWLMTDDDLFADGAVAEVLSHVKTGYDLIFTSAKVCNLDFSRVLEPSLPRLDADRKYTLATWGDFTEEIAPQLTFLGAVIIRRTVWLTRDRSKHYGTGFVHVGVILAAPLDGIIAIARPLVIIRYGNALWRSRAFDIWMDHWPKLVWSFSSLSEGAKELITPRYPFRSIKRLLWYRSVGAYSLDKYRQRLSSESGTLYRLLAWTIAQTPIVVTNALYSLYLTPPRKRPFALQMYDLLHCGYAGWLTRRLAHLRGIQ